MITINADLHDYSESVIYRNFNREGMCDGEDVSELEAVGNYRCICGNLLYSRNSCL